MLNTLIYMNNATSKGGDSIPILCLLIRLLARVLK